MATTLLKPAGTSVWLFKPQATTTASRLRAKLQAKPAAMATGPPLAVAPGSVKALWHSLVSRSGPFSVTTGGGVSTGLPVRISENTKSPALAPGASPHSQAAVRMGAQNFQINLVIWSLI